MALTLRRNNLTHTESSQDDGTRAWSGKYTIVILPWNPTIRPNTLSIHDLAPYRRFKKLYGERKYAQDYPLKPFRFLDLPPEVRNQVYREVLVPDQAIELAPQSTHYCPGPAKKKQQNRFRYDIMPRLRLLRVNKKVNKEATSIFYGENEFRFTNVDGWYILSAFLLTIGRKNCQLLRHIAIHVPWAGKARNNRHDGLAESKGRMRVVQGDLDDIGLKYRENWREFCKVGSIRRCKKFLEDAGKLESVTYVLPDTYALGPLEGGRWDFENPASEDYRHSNKAILDPSKFPKGLKVTLVRLHGGFYKAKIAYSTHNADVHRWSVLQTHVDYYDWFEHERGWNLETVVYDKHGNYPAPLKEGDRILDPRGEWSERA